MKHYLDLVPISAKIHKKQSRMSIFCIVLAVFLVTTIFGMADMFIRSQILQAQQESGNWHIAIKNISNEEAAIIASRPDIEVFSPYGVLNYHGDLGYTLGGKDVAICGCDESYITEIWTDQLEEGVFPQTSNEALVTENAKQIMGVAIGDPIAVETPDGDKLNFTISGFMNNTASIMSGDSYGIILNTEDYCAIYPNVSDGEPNDYSIMFFTQFANTRNIQGKIADLKEQCNLSNEQISSNNNLLGLLGQSRVPFLLQVYLAAAVLFVLVMLAGIMMIASSLNSNVAQRTEFFGLMRCIGATPKQVMRLVRKEALSWCRLAIPVGISIGIVVIWVLCAILRFLSPEFFKAMPTFGFSVPSILAGIVVGLVTVLFAAYSPAKKAAKVSPLAAVSGNANVLEPARNVYYSCSTYKNRSRTACTMHSIKHERLEAAVLFAVQHQVHLAVSYSEIVTQINSAPIKKSQSYRLDDLIAAKERELTKITRYKQSLYQDWKDGEITQQEYRDMKADYERQTSDISAVLTRLNAERAELANGVDNEHPALVAFMKYQNIEALNREILVELVDYIKVYENGNISVKFKFADELRKIAEYIEINTTEDTAVAG